MAGEDKKLEGIDVVESPTSSHTHKAEQKTDTSDDAWDGGVHGNARHVDTGPLNDFVEDDATDTITRGLRQKAKRRKSSEPPPEPKPKGPPPAAFFAGGFAVGGLLGAVSVMLFT